MAAVVEIREPLSPLFPQNSQDLSRYSPAPTKMLQQPQYQKFWRRSASLGASRTLLAENAELMNHSSIAEGATLRRASIPKNTPLEPMAEDRLPAVDVQESQSFPMEEARESLDNDSQAVGEDEQESESLMQLKMEAMTWAAMAKDYTISSLERRLRTALEIAKAEQERNTELERLLAESRKQQEATVQELEDAREQLAQLVEAEERLSVQLGDFEVEAVEEDRRYRSEISALTERLEAQDRLLASPLESVKDGQSGLAQDSEQQQPLAAQLDMAMKEIDVLRADLSNATTSLRASEVLRRNQFRRLKALEKERRYLMRKGAIRSVRLPGRIQMKSETEAPGGDGWKVFSILEYGS